MESGPGSFERRERATRVITYALAAAFYAIAFGTAWAAYGPVAGFVATSPVLAVCGAWWLVHHGTGIRAAVRWLALRKIDGNFHAFDGEGVRIAWAEGQCRVAALDVFQVLRVPLDATSIRRLVAACGEEGFFQDAKGEWWFGESALLQWLDKRGTRLERRENRFRLWLEREAFPPAHRKAGIESRPSVPPGGG